MNKYRITNPNNNIVRDYKSRRTEYKGGLCINYGNTIYKNQFTLTQGASIPSDYLGLSGSVFIPAADINKYKSFGNGSIYAGATNNNVLFNSRIEMKWKLGR